MRSWLRLALAFGISVVAACGSAGGDSAGIDAGRGGLGGGNVGDAGSTADATLPGETTGPGIDAENPGDGGTELVDAGGAEATVPIACPPAMLDAGDSTGTLVLDGGGRTYNVHIPPGLDLSKPAPLVFALHGGGQSASAFEGFAHIQAKADASGFILVEPEGTIALPGLSPGTLDVWNAGNCCELAAEINTNVDDVGFVRAMIDAISQQVCVDPKRIFATGFSNGGMLAHRLACELSDKIAAIAAVSGGIGNVDLDKTPAETLFPCNPGRQVPVLHVHGTQDACYPFDGGWGPLSLVTFVSAPETVQEWVARNGCEGGPPTTVLSNGAATCELYPCPHAGEVEFCMIDGGGHYWPGGDDWAGSEVFCGSNQGARSADLIANDAFWSWFSAHPMP
ncbi:MAG TPA: PHB depolymerase family esterase [Polyangiaceae bacterium]|jgi:polyhydroxybutyrate depolymerase|nr:PHB depolymerase family esterase [Polyangiaceae bacterium]